MAVSGKYGKIEIPEIGEDEPVFVLRVQDRLAKGMIEIYRVIVGVHDSPMTTDLYTEIERFGAWTGERKMPAYRSRPITETILSDLFLAMGPG